MVATTLFAAVSITAAPSAFSSPTNIRVPSPDGQSPCGSAPTSMAATSLKSSVRNTLTWFSPPTVT